MKVTFIIIAYNEERHIEQTVRSIVGLDELGDHEVIVVDDASTDQTRSIVESLTRRWPSVRLLALQENRGRGHARWAGVRAARGDLIATIDADIVLPADWLARCREGLRGHAAVGGIAVPDGDVCYLYNRFGLEPRPVMHATDLTGNNALYDRQVFERVSYDPALRNGEDVALSHAMRDAGLLTRTLDGLYVRHEESKSFRQSVAWLFESGVGASRQLRRYRRIRQPDLVLAGFVSVLGASGALLRRRRGRSAAALPAGFLLAAGAAHVRSRFEVGSRDAPRFAAATAVDAVLLGAYMTGRLIGLVGAMPAEEMPA